MSLKLQKLIVSSFVSISLAGKTVDGITVGKDAFPDLEPATNYDTLGCISQCDLAKETESDEDYCPRESGHGYQKEVTESVISDFMDFTCRELNEIFFRLAFGASTEIVDGASFAPFSAQIREVYCVLHGQFKGSGNTLLDGFLWGKLTLKDDSTFSKDATKPVFRFQVLDSTLNTMTPQAITS